MEKRIKIFRDDWPTTAEKNVNHFLKQTKGKLHELIFKNDKEDCWILIIYTPEGDEDEEEERRAKESKKSNGGIQGRITPLWEQEGSHCKV